MFFPILFFVVSCLISAGKCLPVATSSSRSSGFCGSSLRLGHERSAARGAVARLGLADDKIEKMSTSEKVFQEVQRMADEPWKEKEILVRLSE